MSVQSQTRDITRQRSTSLVFSGILASRSVARGTIRFCRRRRDVDELCRQIGHRTDGDDEKQSCARPTVERHSGNTDCRNEDSSTALHRLAKEGSIVHTGGKLCQRVKSPTSDEGCDD